MGPDIQVVGMATVFAGAPDLAGFWETILTRRRGFRDFPRQRLQLDLYGAPGRDERDMTYVRQAGLIDGFDFDWKAQRVPKAVFEATDPAHWLALATALRAIDDAGVDLDAVGRDRIGVVLGNSLTGEVSRANMLRLRWPYVRQAIEAGATRVGLGGTELAALVEAVEQAFKGPFPVPNEDTLAGALSNVIAGRICNWLDLRGGGFTVDGACASSLLAVSSACEALESGRLDLALAGGVDISLDPLELVGFARTGALTTGAMRVYDRDAAGFLPGEGCGVLVLARGDVARRLGLKPWARIAGWGISSDGAGGITAPKASGQALALRRCYERAGFGADTLDLIEGHGTGTPVGDREELQGFLEVTTDGAASPLRRTGVTSVKTLVGHTKAAAGAAGLIKAVLAVNQRVLPPLAGLETPAEAFEAPGARIYPITRGECLPPETGLRAGVSGAGFGGINCHVAVSGEGIPRRALGSGEAARLLASAQTAELFVASAEDLPGLAARIAELLTLSAGMAEGELVDLAAATALKDRGAPVRAAVVAGRVDELRGRLAALAKALAEPSAAHAEGLPKAPPGTYLGRARPNLRIGLLVPGQGSQFLGMGANLARRYGWAATRRARWDTHFTGFGRTRLSGLMDPPLERADGPQVRAAWDAALGDTSAAQPAIALTSLQWIQWLRQVGLTPSAVLGHSLGEIPALVAARLLSEPEAMELVARRAEACAAPGAPAGGMLALKCDLATARDLVATAPGYAVVANDNAPDQVAVSGEPEALAAIADLARGQGIAAQALKVSRAFHSDHMAGAAASLHALAKMRGETRPSGLPFYSSVLGGLAPASLDPFAYLAEQVAAPVRFREAVLALAEVCDILVEPGPGAVLTGLARRTLGERLPVVALEPGPGDTDAARCAALGRLYIAGALFDWAAVYEDRHFRPFVPAAGRSFIESPCAREGGGRTLTAAAARPRDAEPEPAPKAPGPASIQDTIIELVARETGFDIDSIGPEARLARDLNLDSIKIAEVRAELRALAIDLPADLALGTTPIRDLARLAVRQAQGPAQGQAEGQIGGAGPRPGLAEPDPRAQGNMPRDLPVLGYALGFIHDGTLLWPCPALPISILCAADRAAEAAALAADLGALGVQVSIQGTNRVPTADAGPVRLIALPGGDGSLAVLGDFFAQVGTRLGAGAGRVESLILATRPGLAPVFGFAQSLSLELPRLPILAAQTEGPDALLALALARIDPGVRLLHLTANGTCRRLSMLPWELPARPAFPLAPGDLVAISGGGKGITAECAVALLQATRTRALLLGTSPESAPGAEVEGTLLRLAAAGIQATYVQCDVAEHDSVARALDLGAGRLGGGEVVALIHGAGVNRPALAADLDAAGLAREYAVKVGGLRNLLAAVDPRRLKLCVALGSVIGALGMRGNAGYALANEAMAQVLQDLRAAHPGLQVACPAYSVWSEVGMGAKLNVLEALERQQVAAIPIAEGTRWFLECCAQPDLPLPLVVAAPMHGLSTWRQARGTDAAMGLPYCDPRVVHEPGLILVSRPALNPERDLWLRDHAFRGALLFATVQAMTAIGAGARALVGGGVVQRFLDLRITRPIVAAHQGDTPIELDLRAAEADWDGRIGSIGSAWADPAFAARCSLVSLGAAIGTEAPGADPGPGGPLPAVPAEVGLRLYDWVLFQGPAFQRIEAVLGLDLSDPIRRRVRCRVRREASAEGAPVPDSYFLDAMLQALQILVPKDLCLPVGIAEALLFPAAWTAGETLVEAQILERTPTGYLTRVQAWNLSDAAPVARFEGYRVSIVEHHETTPDADAFFDPLAADRLGLAAWAAVQGQVGGGMAGLSLALGAVAEDHQDDRRAAAATQVAAQLGVADAGLTWNDLGAPHLGLGQATGVSIAHDGGRLLTLCGPGRLGCDLQRIGRTARAWGEILPVPRLPLWHSLGQALKDRERAGALVWAIHEALTKAGAAASEVTFAGLDRGLPLLRLPGAGVLVAGTLDLVLGGPAAVAVVALPAAVPTAGLTGALDSPSPRRISHYSRDIEMTFKESLPPFKSPTASVFFTWVGALREEAMAEIRTDLAQAFGVGGKGMVTNGTRVRILGPVSFAAPLRAWVWLERVLSSHPSTFELGFQWAETGPDGTPIRILAQGLQRLTWVDLGPGGHVRIEPFPGFFADFIAARLPQPGAGPFVPPLGALPEGDEPEPTLWRRDAGTAQEYGAARLWLETDETHSNFVGNIYFSHAAALVERACQKALRRLGTAPGGFFATDFRLDHLGEAMPGDTLEAQVRIKEVRGRSCGFDLALVNQTQGGVRIATGRARYRLFSLAAADPGPLPSPAWLRPHRATEVV